MREVTSKEGDCVCDFTWEKKGSLLKGSPSSTPEGMTFSSCEEN